MLYGFSPNLWSVWRRRSPIWFVGSFVTIFLLFVCVGILSSACVAQTQRCWITFRDRGSPSTTSLANPRMLGISDRALWRRSKVLPPERLVDELDLPLNQSYLDQLHSAGIVIRSSSRWFNAVSAELTASQQSSIANLPFVSTIKPVSVFFKRRPETTPAPLHQPLLKNISLAGIDYGQSLVQLTNIKVVDVHSRGVAGAGVVIGLLDDGFNQHAVHPALKNIKILAEYDFVQRDSNTSRAPGEYFDQGNHGAGTLSTIGGFENGSLVGVAFGASFILAKTEIDSSGTNADFRIEEDLYVEGLEWEERMGADVVSSSLGYNLFVDGPSYSYQEMNGVTATTSKAARIAARKGVLLVTAMGNEGNYRDAGTRSTGTMIAPADADSIISVGAVNADGYIAGFSSTGPTADGRVKPEVVAQGISVFTMYGEIGYKFANGTSFSTPLTAGVAALILSAHPSLTPMQVRDRLTSTAKALYGSASENSSHPNNFYGWGMVDALAAVGTLPVVPVPGSTPDQFVLHSNYPNPFNGSTTIIVEAPGEQQIDLAIYNLLGQRVRTIFRGKSQAGTSYFQWQNALNDVGVQVETGVYFCRLAASGSLQFQKILYIK
ncbi:T9SS C-terminal target domain-containing protein [bacterium]|nr:MAG: T9SS C-terminal target domain-containing protein [bacterium]